MIESNMPLSAHSSRPPIHKVPNSYTEGSKIVDKLTTITQNGYQIKGVPLLALNLDLRENSLLRAAAKRLAEYEESGLMPVDVHQLAAAKAIYEAYDGSKLDKADQYIEQLEAALNKAIDVLEKHNCHKPDTRCHIINHCRECWRQFLTEEKVAKIETD
jgi:hypothetical protein